MSDESPTPVPKPSPTPPQRMEFIHRMETSPAKVPEGKPATEPAAPSGITIPKERFDEVSARLRDAEAAAEKARTERAEMERRLSSTQADFTRYQQRTFLRHTAGVVDDFAANMLLREFSSTAAELGENAPSLSDWWENTASKSASVQRLIAKDAPAVPPKPEVVNPDEVIDPNAERPKDPVQTAPEPALAPKPPPGNPDASLTPAPNGVNTLPSIEDIRKAGPNWRTQERAVASKLEEAGVLKPLSKNSLLARRLRGEA